MPTIKLPNKEKVKVSQEDYGWAKAHKWYFNAKYVKKIEYIGRNSGKLLVNHQLMHRAILERVLDRKLEANELVDHINGDRMDNRRTNLRMCDKYQNQHNTVKKSSNTSGFKGVNIAGNKWQSRITNRGKRIYLGSYCSVTEAARAYNAAALKYHGRFARLNEGV